MFFLLSKKCLFSFLVLIFFIFILNCNKASQEKVFTYEFLKETPVKIDQNIMPFKLFKCKNNYITGDNMNSQVVLISPEGAVLDAFGKKGKAPGEFLSFSGLSVDSNNGLVAIWDNKNARLSLLEIIDNKFVYKKSIQVDNGIDVCIENSQIYMTVFDILSNKSIKLLKVFNEELDLIDSQITKNVNIDNQNDLRDLYCSIYKKNNHLFLVYIMSSKIEQYIGNGGKLEITKTFFADYRNEKGDVIQRESGSDLYGLGLAYLTDDYYIQGYKKQINGENNIFTVMSYDGQIIGEFKINEKNKLWALSVSDDMNNIEYINNKKIYTLKRKEI